MIDPAIANWIANDPSDDAQRLREALAPTIEELLVKLYQFEALAPKPDRWVVRMNPKVCARLLPMSRRKMQPYVRKAWRSHP